MPRRDLFLRLIHLEHHGFDGFADADDLGGVPDVSGPAHLRDVHQAFDARLDLDKGAVVGDRHDLALDPGADRVFGRDVLPGVRLELLHAEADALALPVDVEDLDLDFLADRDHLGRVGHPAVGHVGDVEQPVHAAQVDEGAEVGDVLDHTLPNLADGKLLHQVLALVGPLVLQYHPAADHDVAAPLVELDDLELVGLPQQLVDVRYPPQRDLAAGQEGIDAHEVYHHAALDLLDQGSLDRLIALVGHADLLPDPHEIGLLLRQDDGTFLIFQVLQEDFDLVSLLQQVGVLELIQRDRPLRLEADIEDYRIVGDPEDLGFDDLAFDDLRHGALVHREHLLVVSVGVVFVVEILANAQAGLGDELVGGRIELIEHAEVCRPLKAAPSRPRVRGKPRRWRSASGGSLVGYRSTSYKARPTKRLAVAQPFALVPTHWRRLRRSPPRPGGIQRKACFRQQGSAFVDRVLTQIRG